MGTKDTSRLRLSLDTWERLNLRSSPCVCLPPSHRTPKYVQDFTNGRRTVDPTYPVPATSPPKVLHREGKGGSMVDWVASGYSKDQVGRAKPVVGVGGKVRYANATSEANALSGGRGQKYRGMQAATGNAEYVRPLSRKLTSTGVLSRQSQIETIPGPHRTSSFKVHKYKPSPLHQDSVPKEVTPLPPETALLQRWTVTTIGEDRGNHEGKRKGAAPASTVASLLSGQTPSSASPRPRLKPRSLVAPDLFASSLTFN